jgi:glycosyltransferase involved in cell wall biosynthesis
MELLILNNDNKILFSIITVCYNSALTIEKTIESVLTQGFKNFEFVIIDGASTDETMKIVKKYEKKFNGKLKWKSEPDCGIYDAMNKGIDFSIGDYILFLNSDDYLEENVLIDVSRKLHETNKPSIIYGNSINIYKYMGENVYKFIRAPKIENLTHSQLQMGMCGVRHQSIFTKRSVFGEIGKFDRQFRISADWDFFIRCIKAKLSFLHVDLNISYYSMDGISSKPNYIERHNIRKKNNLYKILDLNVVKDIFCLSNLLRMLLPSKYYIIQFKYNELKNKIRK